MLKTLPRSIQVPKYQKGSHGQIGKTYHCPLLNEKFWEGLIFTLFYEEFEKEYTNAIYIRDLKLGQFNIDIGYND